MGLIRRLLPYTTVVFLLALIYMGWVFFARWRAERGGERASEAKQAEANQKIVKEYGDGHVKILMFYANPPALKRGEKGLLCYGVSNAASVRIEPDVHGVTPSLSRCVEIESAKAAEYTLTADDASGKTESRTVSLAVH